MVFSFKGNFGRSKDGHGYSNNNIPFAAADTFNLVFKDIFLDSKIAKAYASGRMKTTCIVNGVLNHFRFSRPVVIVGGKSHH